MGPYALLADAARKYRCLLPVIYCPRAAFLLHIIIIKNKSICILIKKIANGTFSISTAINQNATLVLISRI